MNEQIVTVQITLSNSSLYFQDLGEMLSRQVSELCSKGNFAHDCAAEIYRALADKLESAEFDCTSPQQMEHLARYGFEEAMSGLVEPKAIQNIQIAGFRSRSDQVNAHSIKWEYRVSKEAKKLHAILEKYVSDPLISDRPITILRDEIIPRIDDFMKAQLLLQELATANGLRIEKSERDWKNLASVDDILKEENEIIFYEDTLTDYRWEKLITNCLKYSVIEADDEDISIFVAAYGQLPDGFKSADAQIDNTFKDWVRAIRDALNERLKTEMSIDDIKVFGQIHGLSNMGISIKNRIEYLEQMGIVIKGKKTGKVFYSLSSME